MYVHQMYWSMVRGKKSLELFSLLSKITVKFFLNSCDYPRTLAQINSTPPPKRGGVGGWRSKGQRRGLQHNLVIFQNNDFLGRKGLLGKGGCLFSVNFNYELGNAESPLFHMSVTASRAHVHVLWISQGRQKEFLYWQMWKQLILLLLVSKLEMQNLE